MVNTVLTYISSGTFQYQHKNNININIGYIVVGGGGGGAGSTSTGNASGGSGGPYIYTSFINADSNGYSADPTNYGCGGGASSGEGRGIGYSGPWSGASGVVVIWFLQ